MFKRVEKRRRKKVEEEELGIDEDMKEILGMHDTDSEESDSDSDQDESSAGDVNEGQQELSETDSFRKGWESDQEEEEEEEKHVITVQEALRDPVYLVSLQPDVKACIVCPGKLLKGAKMVELHRTSKAHGRRVGQFKTIAAGVNNKENAWEIIRRNAEEQPKPSLTPSGNSKRAEKRKEKLAAHKAKRAKQKAKQKAKTATAASAKSDVVSDDVTSHPRESRESTVPSKKRKIDKSASLVSAPPKSGRGGHNDETKHSETVKNIVRSTSERAKQARARFLKPMDSQQPWHRKNPSK